MPGMANARCTRTPTPADEIIVTGTCPVHGEHAVPAADAVMTTGGRIVVCPDEIREMAAA